MDQDQKQGLFIRLSLTWKELKQSIDNDGSATTEDLAKIAAIKTKLDAVQSAIDPESAGEGQTPEKRIADMDSLLEEISSISSLFGDLENELRLDK